MSKSVTTFPNGVKMTETKTYATTNGYEVGSKKGADRLQSIANRRAAITKTLTDAGLLYGGNNGGQVSLMRLSHALIDNPAFVAKLLKAAR